MKTMDESLQGGVPYHPDPDDRYITVDCMNFNKSNTHTLLHLTRFYTIPSLSLEMPMESGVSQPKRAYILEDLLQ
jgi:hypothetical protein